MSLAWSIYEFVSSPKRTIHCDHRFCRTHRRFHSHTALFQRWIPESGACVNHSISPRNSICRFIYWSSHRACRTRKNLSSYYPHRHHDTFSRVCRTRLESGVIFRKKYPCFHLRKSTMRIGFLTFFYVLSSPQLRWLYFHGDTELSLDCFATWRDDDTGTLG